MYTQPEGRGSTEARHRGRTESAMGERFVSFLIAVFLSTSWPSHASAESDEVAPVLADLAEILAAFESQGEPVAICLNGLTDMALALEGTQEDQIRHALGEPNRCYSGAGAPCSRPTDWYYSFHFSSETEGLELLLHFYPKFTVSGAEWVDTDGSPELPAGSLYLGLPKTASGQAPSS